MIPLRLKMCAAHLGTACMVLVSGAVAGPADEAPQPAPAGATVPASPALAELPHTLTFNDTPGLPGLLRIDGTPADVSMVRAIITLDGRLLAAMAKREDSGITEIQFPTPWKTLSYRLQLIGRDQTARATKRYRADERCREAFARDVLAHASGGEAERDLLLEALALDEDNERLEYVTSVLERITR